jgi:exonuclease SbcD
LVELTLVSDQFLTNDELKKIHDSHDGIIHIIPVIRQEDMGKQTENQVNLDQNMEGLFIDYFKSKEKGQEPNEELMALFHEVLNTQSEN